LTTADNRQPSGLIVDESTQRLKGHVAALQLPLVVLLEQQPSDEARDGGNVREDADDIGAPLDLGIEPLQGVGAVELGPMDLGEGHEHEHRSWTDIA
jgi:hypothetical protein